GATSGAMAKRVEPVAVAVALSVALAGGAAPIRVMLLDGANNHDWKATSPVIRKILDEPGIFTTKTVTVDNSELGQFKPDWSQFDVVVLNHNNALTGDGPTRPAHTHRSFDRCVAA